MTLQDITEHQFGFSLVELGTAVVIGAAFIGIGLVTVPSILSSHRASAEVSLLPAVFAKVQKSYANYPNYSLTTQSALINLGVFPDDMAHVGSITNRWGGAVTVIPNAAGINTPYDSLLYTSEGIPSAECSQIVEGLGHVVRVIKVGNVTVKNDGVAADPGRTSINCYSSDKVTLTLTIGK